MTRREAIYTLCSIGYAVEKLSASPVEGAELSQSFHAASSRYKADGTFVWRGWNLPAFGSVYVKEWYDAKSYNVNFNGGKKNLFTVAISSHGQIEKGLCKPLNLHLEISILFWPIGWNNKTIIRFDYKKGIAYFTNPKYITDAPIPIVGHVDDFGSAYLNIRRGNYPKTNFTIKTIGMTIEDKFPGYKELHVQQYQRGLTTLLATEDAFKVAPVLEKGSKAIATLSTLDRVFKEVRIIAVNSEVSTLTQIK